MQRAKLKVDSRGVARLSLNNPDQHNVLDTELLAQLDQLLEETASHPTARLLVLEAAGPSFSAGASLGWLQELSREGFAENTTHGRKLFSLFQKLNNLPLPVLGAVQGNVFGVAAGLVACADVVLCTASARFCFSEVRLGHCPAEAAPFVLAKIGPGNARRLFLTGEMFTAEAAQQMGLVHWVLPDEPSLREQTERVAALCLKGGREAQRLAKALIHEATPALGPELSAFAVELAAHRRLSQEGQEGLAALAERRTPVWVKTGE